jgi:hypothetical protein
MTAHQLTTRLMRLTSLRRQRDEASVAGVHVRAAKIANDIANRVHDLRYTLKLK